MESLIQNNVRLEPPADLSTVNDHREEVSTVNVMDRCNEGVDEKSSEKSTLDVAALKLRNGILRIGEWNVRSLYQAGNVNNLMAETDRMKIDVMGLSEVRWTESGMKEFDDFCLIFSGGDKHQHVVGIMLTKEVSRALLGYLPISDRVNVAKF